jgi:hypothetical protein
VYARAWCCECGAGRPVLVWDQEATSGCVGAQQA